MKIYSILFSLLLTVSSVSGKEKNYTASTPADPAVRTFLGIPLTDSIDFIRWKLKIDDNKYTLECNYGIGKPNTNGFYNGGKKIELTDALKKEKNYYQLYNDHKILNLIELNDNLLHLLDEKNNLLVGNGGWSYTLNNMTPTVTDQMNITAKQTMVKDSIAFEGRTPCGVPGIIAPGKECYKLKWYVVLYANKDRNAAGNYKLWGTTWRETGGRKGNWQMFTGSNGRIIYQLNDENDKPFIYLLKLDEGVLIFTDAKGNLLVGDLDFSYTLNRTS